MQRNQIESLLSTLKGCTFAALDTTTTPVLRGGKSNPQQGRVAKIARGHRVILFPNIHSNGYENMVRRRREAEGNTAPWNVANLQWGQRVGDTPFIEHKGKLYLQVVFQGSGDVSYELDGKPCDKEAIEGLPEDKGSGRQGLSDDNAVIVRTFAIENILAIRALGEERGNPLPKAA